MRPTKLLRDSRKTLGEKEAEKLLRSEFDVSARKFSLLDEVCAQQEPLLASVRPEDIDLYIGIPFCTSRCAYCSFSSALTTKDAAMEEAYVAALLHEIDRLRGQIASRRVRSVYIGGGTPTALPPRLLERVVRCAAEFAGEEFTVEAGRPDTITAEKLEILRDAGADRISVNPQTTCEDTLRRIGRVHTTEEFIRAAELTRKYGFASVNMDLIVGLPGEDEERFLRSLRDVIGLAPENVTVHTLAIKRASKFGMDNARSFMGRAEAERALEDSRVLLREAGYHAYYLYRQKYMAGNLENVGYALPGKACVYNVDIMEETASILAFGAGGISKCIWEDRGAHIRRAAAVKEIGQYIERIDEMADRKLALLSAPHEVDF